MAINAYGVVGSIDDNHWSKLLLQLGNGRDGTSTNGGLSVSVKTGTRTVAVAPGLGLAAGVLVILGSEDTYSVVLDANTSTTQSRIDVVCLSIDWDAATAAYNAATGSVSAKGGAAAAAGAHIGAVKGTVAAKPVPPALVQTAGDFWRIPLARVLVRPGVGQLLASDITDARPVASEKVCSGTIVLSDGGSAPATVDVDFPLGFFRTPPRVQVTPITGAAATTTSNISTSPPTASGFTAVINRSNTTVVTAMWTASGN